MVKSITKIIGKPPPIIFFLGEVYLLNKSFIRIGGKYYEIS